MERKPWGEKEIEQNARIQAKAQEQLRVARNEFGYLYSVNPSHKYNPKTGRLEPVKGTR